MSCCGGYHCLWKKKTRGSNDSAERTSIDDPSVDPSIDPPVETAENPSTDPPDRSIDLPVETAKKTSLPTTSIGPSSSTKPPTTLEEVVSSFRKLETARLDEFIDVIKQLLERVTAQKDTQETSSTCSSNKDKLSKWNSTFQSGKTFLSFVSNNTEKIDTKDDFLKSGEATKLVGDILKQIGHLHWIVATLSIIGYLISKCEKVFQNRTECVELLKDMLALASHLKRLSILISESEKNEIKERLENAFQYIIEGSMFCASQLDSGKFCNFLKTSINSDTLSGIRSKIGDLHRDLQLTIDIEVLAKHPVVLPLSQAEYPKNAVGIEEQLEAVSKLLNMETTEDCSSSVVVIWGFGGIGKTTLARAVVSKIDRSRYNYARITLDEVSEKSKYTEMQQQILKDAFPNYMGGRKIDLRDNEDGKDKLREAFTSEGNKAVFLYIDNALHVKDLENLLPEDLQGLPHHSRILITTRTMGIKDMLEERGFHDRVKDYPVKTLSDKDAMQILCKDTAIRDRIKDNLEKIVNVCKGIPLDLHITLPKSLRVIDIRVQAADLLKMVPNSSLEELRLIFQDNSESSIEEEDDSVDVFNRFLPGLNNLKALAIMNCQSFCELPEQVCRLPQLSKLSLMSCEKIERLPKLFGQLTTLTYLDLRCCIGLKILPSTFGQLTNLTHLNLTRCESLKELPDTLGQLEALQHLNLFCCSSLEELPRGIEQLRSLKCVDLQCCYKLESGICQEEGSIKIVKRSLHSCSDCHRDKKIGSSGLLEF